MIRDTQILALAVDFEPDQHRPRPFCLSQDAHRRFRHDAELSLRSDDKREKIVALRLQMIAADVDDRAVHHDQLDAEDVVGRHAVFQTVRAAGVHRDVASKRTRELA